MVKKSIKNAFKCLYCNDIIESKHKHDFKWCKCGTVFVDGGLTYRRMGGEGLILRNPDGVYKFGRSTPKQQLSIKVKFFEQDEFEIVGFEERYTNTNETTINELGYTSRSSHKDNLVPTNTLGSLVLKCGDTTFKCGTGFTDEQRQEIWDNRDKYLGKLVSVRYMSVGLKERPRIPSFIGWRDSEDMS